jgi:hypothetical protein
VLVPARLYIQISNGIVGKQIGCRWYMCFISDNCLNS